MTLQEINKVWNMLNSEDPEMVEYGITVAATQYPILVTNFRLEGDNIKDLIIANLCREAYEQGKIHAKNPKN